MYKNVATVAYMINPEDPTDMNNDSVANITDESIDLHRWNSFISADHREPYKGFLTRDVVLKSRVPELSNVEYSRIDVTVPISIGAFNQAFNKWDIRVKIDERLMTLLTAKRTIKEPYHVGDDGSEWYSLSLPGNIASTSMFKVIVAKTNTFPGYTSADVPMDRANDTLNTLKEKYRAAGVSTGNDVWNAMLCVHIRSIHDLEGDKGIYASPVIKRVVIGGRSNATAPGKPRVPVASMISPAELAGLTEVDDVAGAIAAMKV